MKIDRIVCCLNENPLYFGYWEIISKIWFKKYKVLPTLAFVGSEEGMNNLNLSEKYGEVHHIKCDPKYHYKPDKRNQNWEVTWALFYAPTLFPDDVCVTTGIDQIPLGNKLFINEVEKTPKDNFLVGFGNAYGHDRFYPSSHLAGTGSMYKETFNIGDTFDEEINKIENHFNKNPNSHGERFARWGTDEEWAGVFLRNNSRAVFTNIFSEWRRRRLDRSYELHYNLEKLKNGEYSEFHLPRPYESHKGLIDKIVCDLLNN